jgi:site-specific DNA-methyltransferase (adenine-specific)
MRTKTVTIGNATLYLGDSFKILPKLDVVADAVITDMPYGVTDCEWDVKIPLDTFWKMVEPLTKPTANFILFSCGRFTFDLYNSNPELFRYDLVWQKSKKVSFLNANHRPMRNHESVLVFIRPGFIQKATYNAQKTAGGRVRTQIKNRKSSVYRDTGEYTHTSDGLQHPCSVLQFKSEMGKGIHPTLKPVDLMEFLVQSFTNENDIVLDPFMGAGSTAIACIKHNRRFIGIEKDKKFFDVAVKRIKEAYGETM